MQKKNKIKIKLNGKVIQVNKGINLAILIDKLNFPLNKIAIEKNNLIVEKKKLKKISLKTNDKIDIKIESKNKKNFSTKVLKNNKNTIRVLKGPQFDYFSKESQKGFFSKEYKISNLTDRMGMRLEGFVVKNVVNTNIRSEGITKGAIQVPADGQPIVLLTDYPTIGGYPKIANIISADYDLLIQKKPGTNISFKCIDLEEAEQLYKDRNKNISKIIKEIEVIN